MKPCAFVVAAALLAAGAASAQPGGGFPGGPGGGFPGGPGGGGPGGMGGQTRKILKDFDKDKNGWLSDEERVEARKEAKKGGGGGFGPRPGGGGFGGGGEKGKPGPKVKVEDAKTYADAKPFDPTVLRTFFFEFTNKDWEQELQDFHGTDVDVTANLTVDGKTYKNVGVHFRGMSSYGMVPAGSKRSLNVSFDTADEKQKWHEQKTLNLLNAHEDPTFLNPVLYSHIANQYIPAPKANVVKVVINGESWGIYDSVQQFDKEFLKENFKTGKGTRWKVRGSPNGRGGLEYLGDKIDDYKRIYEMKTGDGTDEKAWAALINFCKVLNTTPADKLEEALKPICDVDGLLYFLALDVTLINCDGYWIRASDFSIYLDDKNKIHFIPHDMNEAFRQPMGPGMGGGGRPGGGGPGGGFGGPMAPPGTLLPGPLQDELKLTDDQKKALEKIQKETEEKLAELLDTDQKKAWKEMKDRFPGGGRPGGGFPGGPGGGGPGGGGMGQVKGVELDPLVGLTDARKPLRSKVLAVPALKEKYLADVRTIADTSLDWKVLGPVVKQYRTLLEKEIEVDTRKLESFESFKKATADDSTSGGREMSLRVFADQRREYLLKATEPKKK